METFHRNFSTNGKGCLSTIYAKEHEISQKNQMVHDIPFIKALEDVDCRSRRCTVFPFILVALSDLATI